MDAENVVYHVWGVISAYALALMRWQAGRRGLEPGALGAGHGDDGGVAIGDIDPNALALLAPTILRDTGPRGERPSQLHHRS